MQTDIRVTRRKTRGAAYVPPFFGRMYAPPRKGRRHAKLRHVCATRRRCSEKPQSLLESDSLRCLLV